MIEQDEDLETSAPPGPPRRGAEYERDSTHLIRASAIVSALGLAWKAVGVVREAASAAIFGAGRAMDAFVVARTIPDMFSTWIEAPVRSAIVPLFSRRLHQEGEAAAWKAASNIINTLAVLLLPVTLLLFLSAGLMVRALSSGFRDEAAWDESARLTQVLAASVLFSVLAVVLGSLSNVYRRQFVPALGRVLNGVFVLLGVVVLGPRLGVAGYAWGILAGSLVYLLMQADVIWQHRRHYRLTLDVRAPEVRELFAVALPLFIGLTGTRIDVLLDRNFASFLPPGTMAVLAYATILSAMVTDLVIATSHSVLLPHFSQLMAERRFAEVRVRLVQAIHGYCLLAFGVTAITIGAARPLVDLVLARGRFTAEDAALTAALLVIYALADPLFGAGQMLAQVHISREDTKTPMKVGFVRIGFKAVASIALLPAFGVYGLAAASSLSSLLRTVLLWKRLPPDVRPPGGELLRSVGRLLVPTVAAGLVIAGLRLVLPAAGGFASRAAVFGALAAGGLAVYAAGLWLQRDPMLLRLLEMVRARLRRGRR